MRIILQKDITVKIPSAVEFVFRDKAIILYEQGRRKITQGLDESLLRLKLHTVLEAIIFQDEIWGRMSFSTGRRSVSMPLKELSNAGWDPLYFPDFRNDFAPRINQFILGYHIEKGGPVKVEWRNRDREVSKVEYFNT